jgi:hypothetical protein
LSAARWIDRSAGDVKLMAAASAAML